MSSERDATRIVRSFLEEGVAVLPDRVLDAVLDQLPATPQRQAGWLARRFTHMHSNRIRFGAAAAAAAVVALIGVVTFGNIGVPLPTPGASSRSPSQSAAALPDWLQGLSYGPPREIPGLNVRGSFDLEFTASQFVLWTGDRGMGFGALHSEASIPAPGQLRLESTGDLDCERGDVGIYPFSLTPGGTKLTIGAGTDACEVRAAALPGEWLVANCWGEEGGTSPDTAGGHECLGRLEAGTYVSRYFNPGNPTGVTGFGAFSYTVPEGWAASSDHSQGYNLVPEAAYDRFVDSIIDSVLRSPCDGRQPCLRHISLIVGPEVVPECTAQEASLPDGRSADALVAWLTQHPGLVTTAPQRIDLNEVPATLIDIEAVAAWTGYCNEDDQEESGPSVPLFRGSLGIPLGGRLRLILSDFGLGNDSPNASDPSLSDALVIIIDPGDTQDLDAFLDEAMPIVETFTFPSR